MKLTLNTAISLEVSVTRYISVNCNTTYTPTRDEILSVKNEDTRFITITPCVYENSDQRFTPIWQLIKILAL